MKYATPLILFSLFLVSCGNSGTGSSGTVDSVKRDSITAAQHRPAAAIAAKVLDPDTLLDINQFRIGMPEADGYWKKFRQVFYAKDGAVIKRFSDDDCKLRIPKDSVLSGMQRFFPGSTGDSSSIAIRIYYGLDNNYKPQFLFQTMTLKLAKVINHDTLTFDIKPYDNYYTYTDTGWTALSDISAYKDNYKTKMYKKDPSGKEIQIAIDDANPSSDARAVTIPLIEILRLIRDNDNARETYNTHVRAYNDSIAQSPFSHGHLPIRYKELPAISDLLIQCAPRLINNNYFHTINLRPDLANNVPRLPNATLTYAAANYTAMCPPNCDKVEYLSK